MIGDLRFALRTVGENRGPSQPACGGTTQPILIDRLKGIKTAASHDE